MCSSDLYNNSRDASTITPRTDVKELVMPDDIGNLPSLSGFIKFPDGFPAARIRLTWKDYPERAEGFMRVTDMRAAEYVPTDEEAAEMGVGGREGAGCNHAIIASAFIATAHGCCGNRDVTAFPSPCPASKQLDQGIS